MGSPQPSSPAPTPAKIVKTTGSHELKLSKDHAKLLTKDYKKAKNVLETSIENTIKEKTNDDTTKVTVKAIHLDGTKLGRRLAEKSTVKVDWEATSKKPVDTTHLPEDKMTANVQSEAKKQTGEEITV